MTGAWHILSVVAAALGLILILAAFLLTLAVGVLLCGSAAPSRPAERADTPGGLLILWVSAVAGSVVLLKLSQALASRQLWAGGHGVVDVLAGAGLMAAGLACVTWTCRQAGWCQWPGMRLRTVGYVLAASVGLLTAQQAGEVWHATGIPTAAVLAGAATLSVGTTLLLAAAWALRRCGYAVPQLAGGGLALASLVLSVALVGTQQAYIRRIPGVVPPAGAFQVRTLAPPAVLVPGEAQRKGAVREDRPAAELLVALRTEIRDEVRRGEYGRAEVLGTRAASRLVDLGAEAVEGLRVGLQDHDWRYRHRCAWCLQEIVFHGEDTRGAAEGALDAAVRGGDLAVLAGAYRLCWDRVPPDQLVQALNQFGDVTMAGDLLNWDNQAVQEAAEAWAKRRGYDVVWRGSSRDSRPEAPLGRDADGGPAAQTPPER
jgi:hypothetical protein